MTSRTIDGCMKCGACVRECPVLLQEGRDGFPGPRRLAVEGPRFNEELSALRSPLELCTTCARCATVCPSALPLPEALVQVRRLLYRDQPRPEGQERMLANMDRTLRTVLPSGPVTDVPSTGDLLFFPGCIGHGRYPEGITSSLSLIRVAGGRPFAPQGWACCGSPLEKIGDEQRLSRVEAHNRALFRGFDTVVTSCPGCTVQLRKRYGLDPQHIIEHIHGSGRLCRSSFDPSSPPIKVALHSPCHLARVVGPHTLEMARDLLDMVPGVEVVNTGLEDDCCGGGGGVASARPDVAERMAGRKVQAALRAGAQLLLAPCPFCVINLGRIGLLNVQDLTVFLASRLLTAEGINSPIP